MNEEQRFHAEGESLEGYACSYNLDDKLYENLYQLLAPLVRGWTNCSGVPAWKGQEYDVAEDLMQIALLKIFNYLNHARLCHIPIHSLDHLSTVIAKHCFIDLRRREMRLLRFSRDETGLTQLDLLTDPSQEAEEKIYEEGLLTTSARIIATFPIKLRRAILVDLANNSCFTETPTVLQQAFLDVGIRLQEYEQQVPTDQSARGSQAAQRSLAYKRLAQEITRKESGEIEPDIPVILENMELANLALHLKNTRIFVATLSFQERLQSRLLESGFRPVLWEVSLQPILPRSAQHEYTELSYANNPWEEAKYQEYFQCSDELDVPEILNDPELAMLAKQLREAIPPVSIEPVFQDKLLQKLVDTLCQHRVFSQIQGQNVGDQDHEAVLNTAQLVHLVEEFIHSSDEGHSAL